MKLIDMTCHKCGAAMKVNAELSKCMCSYCGNEMLIDHEVQKQEIVNGFDFGYEAERGRIKAQLELKKKLEEERLQQQRAIEERDHQYNTLENATMIAAAIYVFAIFYMPNIGMILVSLLVWLICAFLVAVSFVIHFTKVKNSIMCVMRGYCLGGVIGLVILIVVKIIFPIIGV